MLARSGRKRFTNDCLPNEVWFHICLILKFLSSSVGREFISVSLMA